MTAPPMLSVRCAALVGVLLLESGRCEVTAAASEAPRVHVRSVTGPPRSGRLVALEPEHIELQDQVPAGRPIPAADVVSIEFESRPPVPDEPPAWMLFPNGDRVSVRLLGQEGESLLCRWRSYPVWAPLRVPLEAVAGLMLQPVTSKSARLRLLRDLSGAASNEDVLLLANRDTLSGELLSLTAERCEVRTAFGPVAVETSAVLGAALNPSLVNLPTPEGPSALVRLSDGGWVSLTGLRMEANAELQGRTLFGESVRLPLEDVQRIDFFGRRVVSLAALTPESADLRPWLSPPRSLRLRPNRNVRGGFLSVRGVESPRGWGLTSDARVTFLLEGQYSAFQSTIGIDDAASGGGAAVFGVELDQRRVYTSPLLTGESDPVEVGPLDVRGAVELTLVVEYGESGDVLDYADWVDAVLIREPAP